MKKTFLIALVSLTLASTSYANERYIVTIKGSPGVATAAIEKSGGRVLRVFDIIPAIAVTLPSNALPGLNRNSLIINIKPDISLTAIGKPTGKGKDGGSKTPPLQENPYGIDMVMAPQIWSITKGAGVKVAVLDTGIDKDHSDLIDNIRGGQNFVFKRGKISPDMWDDDNGHGTHVAGTIAATDNTIGVVGVPSVSLYDVKALNKNGSGYLTDIIAGIEWSVANGIDIVSMSLGTNTYDSSLEQACSTAHANGVVLIAAFGNNNDPVSYPAAFSSVLAVAAVDANKNRASFSSYGSEVALSAPGVNVFSTWKGNSYKYY